VKGVMTVCCCICIVWRHGAQVGSLCWPYRDCEAADGCGGGHTSKEWGEWGAVYALRAAMHISRAVSICCCRFPASQSGSGSTALILASYMGHPEVVKVLLAAGAETNTRNNVSGVHDCRGCFCQPCRDRLDSCLLLYLCFCSSF
jgi:ankyrin repeat protein